MNSQVDLELAENVALLCCGMKRSTVLLATSSHVPVANVVVRTDMVLIVNRWTTLGI